MVPVTVLTVTDELVLPVVAVDRPIPAGVPARV